MQWVETTGRSVEAAKEAALDELGVDESEAEFEVLEEARAGLFGRLRSEARVRARVKPTIPRAKDDRRDRRRRRGGTSGGGGSDPTPSSEAEVVGEVGPSSPPSRPDAGQAGNEAAADGENGSDTGSGDLPRRRRRRRGSGDASGAPATDTGAAGSSGAPPVAETRADRPAGTMAPARRRPPGRDDDADDTEQGAGMDVALEEQGRIAEEFLNELVHEFGLAPQIATNRPDDDTIELQLTGSGLGLLIGPKGATLLAIQDLTRTIVHHKTGANNGRIHVDVGGYRQKRTEALVRFAQQVATTVRESGARTALEPMSAVDRKVVHDTISSIDGVSTVSEGEEPRRRVVIVPADG